MSAPALLGISLALVTASARAQLPAAVPPPPPPPAYWAGSITAGLTLTRGNSDTTVASGKLEMAHKTNTYELLFEADGTYGTDHGVENAESWHGMGQYNILTSDRLYFGINGDYLHDAIADVRYRFTVAPLAGYYFLKQTNMSFTVEAGPAGVYQDLGGEKQGYATLRVGERFEWKFAPAARVWESVDVLPQIDKPENYYINAEIGLEAALVGHWVLRSYIDDNYYNIPAPGRLQNDMKWVTALAYKF